MCDKNEIRQYITDCFLRSNNYGSGKIAAKVVKRRYNINKNSASRLVYSVYNEFLYDNGIKEFRDGFLDGIKIFF